MPIKILISNIKRFLIQFISFCDQRSFLPDDIVGQQEIHPVAQMISQTNALRQLLLSTHVDLTDGVSVCEKVDVLFKEK